MQRHVRKSEKIVGGGKRGGEGGKECAVRRERERERLRLGRVAQQRGRVRVVREWRGGSSREGG